MNGSIFESINYMSICINRNLNNCVSEEVIKIGKYHFIPVPVTCSYLEKMPDI